MTKDFNKGDSDERLAEREWMVQTQLISRDITDEAVINSMLIVPRHKYVMEDSQEYAYYDTALEIEAGQTISQPYIVALMAQALELKTSDNVLEIGTQVPVILPLFYLAWLHTSIQLNAITHWPILRRNGFRIKVIKILKCALGTAHLAGMTKHRLTPYWLRREGP